MKKYSVSVENPLYVLHRFSNEDKSLLNNGGNFVPYYDNPHYLLRCMIDDLFIIFAFSNKNKMIDDLRLHENNNYQKSYKTYALRKYHYIVITKKINHNKRYVHVIVK